MYLEDESSPTISLDGEWGFRLAGSRERFVHVPAAWETYSADKLTHGPGAYRRRAIVPESWSGARVVLEAGAISFHATLRVNGAEAGSHRGMWSPVKWDITPFIRPGKNEIEIEVWKPGARYPVRESLAGFLSDVATTFGGIWQGIRLRSLRGAAFGDLRVRAASAGRVTVSGTVIPLEAGSPDSPVHVRERLKTHPCTGLTECGKMGGMNRKRYLTDVTNAEWRILEPLMPPTPKTGRPRQYPWREIMCAIFYVVRGGIPWRMLPHDLPLWPTVYYYFRQWRKDGTWECWNAALREKVRVKAGRDKHPSAAILDSQSGFLARAKRPWRWPSPIRTSAAPSPWGCTRRA